MRIDPKLAKTFNPKLARAYLKRGGARFKKGEHEKAIKDFTESIRLDPKFEKAYNDRGVAWKTLGDLDKADRDFAEANRLRRIRLR